MKLWITGAKGLLGTALAEKSDLPCVLSGREVDIGDYKAVLAFSRENPGITHIVNSAAYSQVDHSEKNRTEAFAANALGPENLGKLAKNIGAHLTHISTDYVFPGDIPRPLKEGDFTGPCNYYGETKLEGEKRLEEVNKDALILRTSWIFGNGGKNFVAKLLDLMKEKEEVRLTDDQWGRPTYVEDLVKVIFMMRGKSGLYQFANSGVTTKFLFGCTMRDEIERLGLTTKAKLIAVPGSFFSSPCARPKYSAFDTAKIENELKINPRPWKEGLQEYLCNLFAPSRVS